MKIRKYLVLGLLLTTLSLSACKNQSFLQSRELEKREEKADPEDKKADPEHKKADANAIWVQIQGAVDRPGVYPLPRGSRLKDLIALAGGLCQDADSDRVNQVVLLEDGAMYRIPRQGDQRDASQEDPVQGVGPEAPDRAGKVNINRAGRDQLMTLPGIGAGKADAIISYRKKHGAFARKEDIMKIPGLKEAAYAKIKDRITVN